MLLPPLAPIRVGGAPGTGEAAGGNWGTGGARHIVEGWMRLESVLEWLKWEERRGFEVLLRAKEG